MARTLCLCLGTESFGQNEGPVAGGAAGGATL